MARGREGHGSKRQDHQVLSAQLQMLLRIADMDDGRRPDSFVTKRLELVIKRLDASKVVGGVGWMRS
jgi:hypothetical protein